MADYMPIEAYPKAIKEISEALTESRRQLKVVQEAIKYKKAYMLRMRMTDADGSNDTKRAAALVLKLQQDAEYLSFLAREEELVQQVSSLEAEQVYRRDQFSVAKLQVQEKIHQIASWTPNQTIWPKLEVTC